MHGLKTHWRETLSAMRGLDPRAVYILVTAAVLLIVQEGLGGRLGFDIFLGALVPPEAQPLWRWGWWSLMQLITGMVVPLCCMWALFRVRPQELGMGLGDWRAALAVLAVYLPAVAVGTWFVSSMPEMLSYYPRLRPAATDWSLFLAFHCFMLIYFIGWEFFFRGWMLFGLWPSMGLYAVFVQVVPFAAMHFNKPFAEGLLSVAGGVALGLVVWRCRSFWVAVPLHAAQALFLDLWCVLRLRGGVRGVGWDALCRLLGG